MSLRLAFIPLFFAFLNVSESRVKFTYSSVYDEFDFTGNAKTEIGECSSVSECALFVSILSDEKFKDVYANLFIAPENAGKWNVTIAQMAAMRDETTKAIDPYFITDGAEKPSIKIFLYNDNEKLEAAPLVLYAVNLDGGRLDANFGNSSVFDAADITGGIVEGKIVTVLSALPFTTTILGGKCDVNYCTIATIFATGFDNADSNDENPDNCRRVMQTKIDQPVTLQINGPIASIYFSDGKGILTDVTSNIKTALTFKYDNLELKSRGFVTSQGYVGCQSGQVYSSSLYQYDERILYELFTDKSQFVHMTAFVNSDDERPLTVISDNALRNFIGQDLLKSDSDCFLTHKLEVGFNQTQTNSFALVYSYSNTNCDYEVITSTTPKSATTSKALPASTSAVVTKQTSGSEATTSPLPSKTTTVTIDSTTSSAFGLSLLSLVFAVTVMI